MQEPLHGDPEELMMESSSCRSSASQIVMSDQESPRHIVGQALCLIMLKLISGANQLCKMLVRVVRILEFVNPAPLSAPLEKYLTVNIAHQVKKPAPKPKPAAKPAESKDDSQVWSTKFCLLRLDRECP